MVGNINVSVNFEVSIQPNIKLLHLDGLKHKMLMSISIINSPYLFLLYLHVFSQLKRKYKLHSLTNFEMYRKLMNI